MPVDELKARLDIRDLPEEDKRPLQHAGRPADGGVGPPAGVGERIDMRRLGVRGGRPGRPRIDKVLATTAAAGESARS
jgi:hypothetical protein